MHLPNNASTVWVTTNNPQHDNAAFRVRSHSGYRHGDPVLASFATCHRKAPATDESPPQLVRHTPTLYREHFITSHPAPLLGARHQREHEQASPAVPAKEDEPGPRDPRRLRPDRGQAQLTAAQAAGIQNTGGVLCTSRVGASAKGLGVALQTRSQAAARDGSSGRRSFSKQRPAVR